MAGDQSFGIRTAKDLVEKLVRPDLDTFRAHLLDPAVAIRVAMSFNQLVDWVFEERGSLDLAQIGVSNPASLRDLRGQVEKKCPELLWLKDIADGSKHATITRHSREVMGSDVAQWGQLAWGEFPSDRPVLAIELSSGEYKSYEDVVETAAAYWRQLFPGL